MGKIDIDPETIAKAAGAGGALTVFLSWFRSRGKERYRALQAEVTTMHSIIDEWKTMAIEAIEENKKLRLQVVRLEGRIVELEKEVKSLKNER